MHTDEHGFKTDFFFDLDGRGHTEKILGAAFKVQNTLGAGFLEKVYENALSIELRNAGLQLKARNRFRFDMKGS